MWIGGDEVFREQAAGPQRPACNRLACGNSDADIGGIQRVRYIPEIAVRDVRPERGVPAQGFRAGNIAANHADTGAEIQTIQHLVKHGAFPPARVMVSACNNPLYLEIRLIVVDR